MSKTETTPIPVAAGEIPLPPQEMWAALDNSGAETAPAAAPDASKAAPRPAPEVATLTFVGAIKPFREIALRFPFQWEGRRIDAIIVHRLSVQQLGDFFESLPDDGAYDRMAVYGLMCGLPAAVVRALPDADGAAVTGACFDFLPPSLGGASG